MGFEFMFCDANVEGLIAAEIVGVLLVGYSVVERFE